MAIDWKLYERDVNRWYLDEAKTANDVIKLLREKHNLQVTLRQFKAKFGGCKKISSKEWSILIPKIQEREANGLGSVIYVCGKAVKRESMTRSLRRYSRLCRDGSQPDTSIDLGIDTISQHRIEIRTTSRSERRLPSDNSAAEIQSSHKGERTLEPQNDELGIGQEFGLAGMDVGFPSPSMFLRALDQLPLDMLTIPFIPDTSEIPMDSDGMVPFNSGRALLSPSLDPTTWFSFRHSFTSFWDSPDISSLSLKSCMAVGIARRIGIFVPDHGPNELLLKLNLSTAQMEALTPITHSIKELLDPVEPSFSRSRRTRSESRVQLRSSPNLLDIPDTQSLDQALSVFVYMVSNNLLSSYESHHFISWILKRGHATSLLAFSQRPVVGHLAFGSAFLRTICEAACSGRFGTEEKVIIGDFVSSNAFLSLVKSHQGDLSGPLGVALFRLAIKTDSMELAKLLAHDRLDVTSDQMLPWESYQQSILDHAISSAPDSMLEYVIRLGVNAKKHPEIHAVMRRKLGVNSEQVCWELLYAARKGNRELSKACLAYHIVSPRGLEDAMCKAIELGDLPATRTFLKRGTNPDVGLATFRDYLNANRLSKPFLADIFYLLAKAGAQINNDTALSIRNLVGRWTRDRYTDQPSRLLRILLHFGYDEAWIHQYLLTLYAQLGSIFDCEICIDSGTQINAYGIRGQSALQIAAAEGHLTLVQHLISRGADPNLPPSSDHPEGVTALYAALATNHWDVGFYLVECGADVKAKATTAGFTFLEGVVVHMENSETIEDLDMQFRKILALGAPVNRPDGTDSFLLHGLLHNGQLDCLELALEAGARTEDKYQDITPIQLAVLLKDSDGLHSLLKYSADVNARPSSISKHTATLQMPLPRSARSHTFWTFEARLSTLASHFGFRENLTSDGLTSDGQPCSSYTPLQIASSCCDRDIGIVELLLRHGADINAPAGALHGRTALQGAISAEELNMDIVNMLLDRGADVNAPPAQVGGLTALQGAAIQGNIQLVRLLLARGADINAPGSPEEGRTVLEGAAEHGRIEMLRFLLSRGAKPDPITGYSRAIELAEKQLHLGIVKFLRGEQRKFEEVLWGAGLLGLGWDSL